MHSKISKEILMIKTFLRNKFSIYLFKCFAKEKFVTLYWNQFKWFCIRFGNEMIVIVWSNHWNGRWSLKCFIEMITEMLHWDDHWNACHKYIFGKLEYSKTSILSSQIQCETCFLSANAILRFLSWIRIQFHQFLDLKHFLWATFIWAQI